MAPVLVCPECQTKHPLDSIGPRSAFPCTGCGRTLKVPGAAIGAAIGALAESRAPAAPPIAPPVAAPVSEPVSPLVSLPVSSPEPEVEPDVTGVVSTPVPPIETAAPIAPPVSIAAAAPVPGPPPGMPTSNSRLARVHAPVPNRFVRFALWIVAVPLAFLVVFGLARAFGLLSTNDVTDVALAEGWQRFMPIVRLLPFVALATAGFVHGGVFGITRLRERGHPGGAAPAGASAGKGPKPAWGARPRPGSKPGAARPRQSSGKGA